MVLENAQVLDNAIVEESAIIRGNARISGNARVAGQAVIGGDVQLSGYQRTWHTTGSAAPSETVPGAKQEFHGLWHNYAMDEESKMMLEDRFKARGFGTDLAHPIEAVKKGEKEHPWQIDAITGATISSNAIASLLGRSTEYWIPRIRRNLDDMRKAE